MSALLSYASSLPGKLGELDLAKNISKADGWTKACLAAIGTYGAYQGVGFLYTKYQQRVNDKKRNKKRQENEKSIGDLRRRVQQNPLSESEVQRITHLEFTDLLDELKSGKLRPINALRAFQTQALRAHEKTNCLIEAIVEAEDRALELEKGPREGLLWGLPISIKDDVRIKGYDSTLGLVDNVANPSKTCGTILQVLLNHGAIPFVKTNVPQSEMSFEPGNPINGLVHNPHDHTRIPAGSSSGEAALIASYGSPLGVGSDLGGSIRVPAHFCGVQGFKPTSERNSIQDMAFEGAMTMTPYRGVWGPMSRDVDGLVQQMRALWEDCHINQYDNSIPWQPFDTKAYSSDRKLRIGYYTETGDFPTVSACKRGVMEAVDLLKQQGHEVVPWQAPHIQELLDIADKVLSLVGGEIIEALKYDRVHPTIGVNFEKKHPVPDCIRRVFDWLIRPLCPGMADKLGLRVDPMNAMEFMEVAYQITLLRRAFYQAWTDAKLDAVIAPPNVMVAPPFGSSKLMIDTGVHTYIYNVLHYPAGVVKMTDVKQADLHKLNTDYPETKDQRQQQAKAAMKGSVGLPVGVMVVTPRYQDETCLRIMKLLEDSIRKSA